MRNDSPGATLEIEVEMGYSSNADAKRGMNTVNLVKRGSKLTMLCSGCILKLDVNRDISQN